MYRKIEPCAPTNYVICAVALQGLRWMTSCSFLPSSSPDCSCWNAVAAIKEEVMRTHPWNYLGLLFMTIMQTCWVSYICAWVPWETCAYALCGTLGIVLLLILFACQTKYDFTGECVRVGMTARVYIYDKGMLAHTRSSVTSEHLAS
eukprot:GHVU01134253.1.p2 GENE.GHVU01134253.1~~GHVU01134253.1.p2  ORF type:complete len:147 (+),score=9.29 GHVU01134253.1:739-1179(+)